MATRTEKRPTAELYSVHPGVVMMQKWVTTLREKSGRSLDEWVALVERQGPATEPERRAWLKAEHGMGTNSAWWIAERAAGKGSEDTNPVEYLRNATRWVEAMFAGKEALRPIYDAVLHLGLALGADVKACPGKTIVPLYRKRVFAELKPSTRTRLDLGLALGELPAKPPLVATSRSKGNRISHRIPLSSLADVDAEATRWLRRAYDLDA